MTKGKKAWQKHGTRPGEIKMTQRWDESKRKKKEATHLHSREA